MKTTKRTIPCHVCGASTTTAWHSCVDIDGKTYCYPVTNCPNCHASARGKIALYSRICRKNRVRQLKRTITRLKASLGVEKIRSGACYSLFKKELVLAHKGKARAARWKRGAKKYMMLLQEQEADRQILVNASLWARAWKAAAKKFRALTFKFWVARRWARAWKERAKHYKNESNVCLETARDFARYYEKACKELNAHGLLQDFLARLEKEEGGGDE